MGNWPTSGWWIRFASSTTTITASTGRARSGSSSAGKGSTSLGAVGDSYDNAMAETVIGLYKAELIHRRGPWRRFEDVEIATLEWIDWWNRRRIHSAIGDVPPAEFEAAYATPIADDDSAP
ncbi:MAG: integrase core domain-containing protein [Actinomycetota bacterium]